MNKLKQNDLFCVTFLGQFVEVMVDVLINGMPMLFYGYFLDYDDDFYYFGNSQFEVDSTIKRHLVIGIQLSKQKTTEDEAKEYLQNLPNPKNEDEIN